MQIRVALSTKDLTKLIHTSVSVSSVEGIGCFVASLDSAKAKTAADSTISVSAKGNVLQVSGVSLPPFKSGESLTLRSLGTAPLIVTSLKRQHGAANPAPHYLGSLEIKPVNDSVRIILITDLESYVKGVLQSEIPASYEIEAIKAQAVAARTYALRPRLDHTNDFSNVCDSFLCCQYFAGVQTISERHREAIADTTNEILTYEGKPILALFSSNAGSCTEDYQNCFSDPATGAFPPQALPYLQSESEKDFAENKQSLTEASLRAIYFNREFVSADSWSPHFRWSVNMPASALEAHMHHEISEMRKDPTIAPFIVAPASQEFGHIKSFKVTKRGKSGSAIELAIETSTGVWTVKKELVIRSVFKNSELKLTRLKSAKLFFDFKHDSIGLLSYVTVNGLGWGHGVGMQQTGAQGWAKRGKNYKQILAHYFRNSEITKT